MKKLFYILLITSVSLFAGCQGLSSTSQKVVGKDTKVQTELVAKINTLDDKKADINEQRLTQIGGYSYGVAYSLGKITNPVPADGIAMTLNDKVTALANKPTLEDISSIKILVDTYLTNQIVANKMLRDKDEDIIQLNNQLKKVNDDKEAAVAKAIKSSETIALKADTLKSTLDKMDSFWGLGSIIYGFKKMFSKLLITAIIILVLYFGIRIAAAFNPIASTIFTGIETSFSIVVRGFKAIFPKSINIAGFTSTSTVNNYQSVLKKIIDAVEVVQDRAAAAKTQPLVTDVMLEMQKSSVTTEEQAIIDNIKKELNWK